MGTREMYSTKAIARKEKDAKYEVITIKRGRTSEDDVDIDILFCGFSPFADVNLANYAYGSVPGLYAVVGHEIAGVVSKVGDNVEDLKVGDKVGVGYFIDSCLECEFCSAGQEYNCKEGITRTSCGILKHGRVQNDNGRYSYGGRSGRITVNRRFVSRIAASYPLDKAAPVFCAGVTMFTPLQEWGAGGGGLRVGVVGCGGLGQMGVMMAKAMGNSVTVISTSNSKEELARKLGADDFILSKQEESMKTAGRSLDIILDTVGADHELMALTKLLKKKGTIVVLGIVSKPFQVDSVRLIEDQIRITGSDTGGMRMTQDCIDFMAKHSLFPETKLIKNLEELDAAEKSLKLGTSAC